ncbi:hypothetical protein [Bacillus sp. CECT 9360]|uniref:hypothetical protein n=1 Tax=Bacillus sp. CECT 9360 TaxID=2845821 RepID=UPI001E63573E|nr:hypothetical protein [Bacillus sp. CECT 9360]CAH0344034.1 hypothetical protein BCI9360_00265 [Bacillus sp. CECT 9360]
MTWFFIIIAIILLFALFIDWRRKIIKNNHQTPTNPHSRKGEDANHTMGDNRYTGGGPDLL